MELDSELDILRGTIQWLVMEERKVTCCPADESVPSVTMECLVMSKVCHQCVVPRWWGSGTRGMDEPC